MSLINQWLLGAGVVLAFVALFVVEYSGVERAARRNREAEEHAGRRADEARSS
jgi:Na+-transporting methylmalonyl-CoA/oxaloacetate decarboxylase gamma subunit